MMHIERLGDELVIDVTVDDDPDYSVVVTLAIPDEVQEFIDACSSEAGIT